MPAAPGGDWSFRDAEAWLAERGIRRESIQVPVDQDATPTTAEGEPDRTSQRVVPPAAPSRPVSGVDTSTPTLDVAATKPSTLDDEVAEALSFVRDSTARAPQAEGRLRAKLATRGWSDQVIDETLTVARRVRLVDDAAMAAALVAEAAAKGHGPIRVRQDLRRRGFDPATIDAAVVSLEQQDQGAAAFAVAQHKASALTAVEPETAYRRVVGYVARRGYPEALARKVAREAVFTAQDADRIAGH